MLPGAEGAPPPACRTALAASATGLTNLSTARQAHFHQPARPTASPAQKGHAISTRQLRSGRCHDILSSTANFDSLMQDIQHAASLKISAQICRSRNSA